MYPGYDTSRRRDFLKIMGTGVVSLVVSSVTCTTKGLNDRPNIILCMSDDQGWGDTGYNGHPELKTPNLDDMAKQGLRFDRFYAAAPVCSPTRGSCLTGRHPYRYGIFWAFTGHMRKEEITLAEALNTLGYATGHFGKWHLGWISPEKKEDKDYSPPDLNGFDEWFSTRHSVPTWNPWQDINQKAVTEEECNRRPDRWWEEGYYHNGKRVTQKLTGDDSRVIMDRAIPFIRKSVEGGKPFFLVIWFHAPHSPVVAGPEYRKMYDNLPVHEQHHHGCITAMDEQIGRLRLELRDLGVAKNTLLWFCSDNGPAYPMETHWNKELNKRTEVHKRLCGTAGPFRGKKRSLFEGGVRVPALLEWPDKIKKPRAVKMACCTSDYFPTVMDILGLKKRGRLESLDGVSLLPMIEGKMTERPNPLAFESRDSMSLTDNRYKIIKPGAFDIRDGWADPDDDKKYMLFDLIEDLSEKKDLAAMKPEIVKRMKLILEKWRESCKKSYEGEDYREGP